MNVHAATTARAVEVTVWDPFVRVFHWSLVALFVVAYVSGEDGARLHAWAGYGVLGLLAARVLWGFVGTRHARFSDFVFGPHTILVYVKDLLLLRPRRYLGHNPLGGAMIVLMLVTLLVAGLTGLALDQTERGGGPLASAAEIVAGGLPAPIAAAHADSDEEHEHEDGAEWLEDAHELLADFMVLLVLLHLAGVALGSWAHRENLGRAMFTGRKHI